MTGYILFLWFLELLFTGLLVMYACNVVGEANGSRLSYVTEVLTYYYT